MTDYVPPEGSKVALTFGPKYAPPDISEPVILSVQAAPEDPKSLDAILTEGDYVPPRGNLVGLEFAPGEGGPAGEDQYLFPEGYKSSLVSGQVQVKLHTRYLVPAAIQSALAFGSQSVHNYLTFADPGGIDSAAFGQTEIKNRNRYFAAGGFTSDTHGNPSVINWNKDVYPDGFKLWKKEHKRFGRAYIWNLLQIPKFQGFDSSVLGEPYLIGGVKFVDPKGKSQGAYGKPDVINTTADQPVSLRREGIKPPYVPEPDVSPRILFVEGILGTEISVPLVQFPPFPVGWESSRYGRPEIDYWTKYALPEGIDPTENIGYPFIRDRAQKVYPPSFRDTTIFGDTAAENNAFTLFVEGLYASYYSNFADIRSNRRPIKGRGYDAQLWGDAGIRNKTPSFAPIGYDLSLYGMPAIGHRLRYLYGRGFSLDNYGHASLSQTPSFAPAGIEGGFIGPVVVTHGERTLEVEGDNSQAFGGATVWHRVRGTQLDGFTVQGYGEPLIEYKNRRIQGVGKATDRHGRPAISNANQWVRPEGVFKEFASAHMVGGLRFIGATGFEATRFGERIIPEIQFAYPQGFGGRFGQQRAYNLTQIAYPLGLSTTNLPTGRWGVGKFYNLSQYISMYYFVESQLNPPDWSRWTLIENRTKTIGAIGQNTQLFGYATLENNARLLSFEGIDAPAKPEFYEAGMVAYRVRRLPVQGLESPYMSSWVRVYNDAFVVAPPGFRADVYGDAELEATRRYFRYIGAFKSERIGTPMISDRIRELTFERRYTIHPPSLWMPRVDLYTRYIDGIGEDLSGMGWHSLQIVFRKITTRWSHSDRFGWADLWNVTPEVNTRGRAADLYGDTSVRLEWRPVNPDGTGMDLFGRASIADRDRSVSARGFRVWAFGDDLEVIQGGQPPYTDQRIDLPDEKGGIEAGGDERKQVPNPFFNQYVLYADGFKADKHGNGHVQSNALIVDSGINDSENGEPDITMMLRGITVPEAEDPPLPGKPRITPHTIWARPAPGQAIANHPESDSFRPVGSNGSSTYKGARFGRPHVSTWLGEVYPRSAGSLARIGRPSIQLHKRYIEPEAISAYRNGWNSIDGGFRFVVQFKSTSFMILGRPSVDRPPYTGPQYIKPKEIKGLRFGRHIAEPLNRTYRARGLDSLEMGKPAPPGNPYMWQGLRVGPLMPTIPDGLSMDEYGDTWISHRVRGLSIEGFYTFLSEYDVENFEERMRISLTETPLPPSQSLSPVGVDVSSVSAPNVWPAARYILPDGNADQYRKGAPN